jgi:hypothetical protein
MTRRRMLLFGLLAAVAAVVGIAVAAWLLWPGSAITRENAADIREGMTLAEVEAMLGGPARDETTGPVEREEPPEFAEPDARGIRWRITFLDMRSGVHRWESDQARVWVHFDDAGRATDCHVFPMRRVQESPLAMVRRWMHL